MGVTFNQQIKILCRLCRISVVCHLSKEILALLGRGPSQMLSRIPCREIVSLWQITQSKSLHFKALYSKVNHICKSCNWTLKTFHRGNLRRILRNLGRNPKVKSRGHPWLINLLNISSKTINRVNYNSKPYLDLARFRVCP